MGQVGPESSLGDNDDILITLSTGGLCSAGPFLGEKTHKPQWQQQKKHVLITGYSFSQLLLPTAFTFR